MIHLTSPAWAQDAACAEVGPGPWDSVEGRPGPGHWAAAKAMCATCPVRLACLEDAMTAEQGRGYTYRDGLWGGLSPRQRSQLATDRRKAERGAA